MSPTSSSSTYSEDLSVHRPRVETEKTEAQEQQSMVVQEIDPNNHQTDEINQKIESITSYNSATPTAPGFTIQVYSGTSREEASQVKSQVYRILPNSRPETKYEQPIYRVRVGDFVDRLEAQDTYAKLQKEFPGAIVIPTRIRL